MLVDVRLRESLDLVRQVLERVAPHAQADERQVSDAARQLRHLALLHVEGGEREREQGCGQRLQGILLELQMTQRLQLTDVVGKRLDLVLGQVEADERRQREQTPREGLELSVPEDQAMELSHARQIGRQL